MSEGSLTSPLEHALLIVPSLAKYYHPSQSPRQKHETMRKSRCLSRSRDTHASALGHDLDDCLRPHHYLYGRQNTPVRSIEYVVESPYFASRRGQDLYHKSSDDIDQSHSAVSSQITP